MKIPVNQNGLTLPELLLALALFSMVMVLAGSLLSQSVFLNKNMELAGELRKQGNFILISVREQAEEESIQLCTINPQTLSINGDIIWTHDQLLIQELYIEPMESSSPKHYNPHISRGDVVGESCVTTSKEHPTYFSLTLMSIHTGKEFTVSTIIRKRPVRVPIQIDTQNQNKQQSL